MRNTATQPGPTGSAREAIRNAAKHARRPEAESKLALRVAAEGQAGLKLVIEDNGQGWEPRAGNADEPPSGSGQGLALHGTLLAVVGGTLAVESAPGRYTRVLLTLPPLGNP